MAYARGLGVCTAMTSRFQAADCRRLISPEAPSVQPCRRAVASAPGTPSSEPSAWAARARTAADHPARPRLSQAVIDLAGASTAASLAFSTCTYNA